MASLKDMRCRIAPTKATQKITKAMQMVAASKLRRATAAAEASRPYAERMEKVLGNIAASVAGHPGAPKLLSGPGCRAATRKKLTCSDGAANSRRGRDLGSACLCHGHDRLDLHRVAEVS